MTAAPPAPAAPRMTVELDIPATAAERVAQEDRECQCPICGRLHRHLRAGTPPKDAPVEPDFAADTDDRCRNVVEQLVKAVDDHQLEMNSPEIGDPDVGIPMHPWHEELMYYAREALAAGRQAAPPPEGGQIAAARYMALEEAAKVAENTEDRFGYDTCHPAATAIRALANIDELHSGFPNPAVRIATLEAALRKGGAILDDMIPYAQATIGLPRPSWSYDNVILRAERWKAALTPAGAGEK